MKRWRMIILVAVMLMALLCMAAPAFFAAERENFPTQTMDIYAIPNSSDLCLVSIGNGVTVVTGYDPDQDRVVYSTPLNWRHDACFLVGDKLVFTRQDSRFDTGTNTFRFALQITTVRLTDGEPESSIELNGVQTTVGRVAVTENRIAVIDNDASHSILLYNTAGTLLTTIQTDYDNLRMEGTDGEFLFLSHGESDSLYALPLQGDNPADQIPAPLSGVPKPLIAAWDGLLLTDDGIYRHDPAGGAAYKGLDIPIVLAVQREGRSYFTSGTSLSIVDNTTLELLYSSDIQANVHALSANADGLWRLVSGDSGRTIVFLPQTDMFPPETEQLSGDLYPVPDQDAWKGVWKQAATGLPADRSELFNSLPSATPPFQAGQIDSGVLDQAAAVLNTCRTMNGLQPLSVDASGSSSLQYGAVLLSADRAVPVNGRKPEGMSDSFYDSGLSGIQNAKALFLNGVHPLDDLISSLLYATTFDFHRQFFSPRTISFRMGMSPSGEDGVTALVSLQEDEAQDFGRQFYCWPSHGAFPVEYARPLSHWLVMLNPDELLAREEKLTATMTDRTGESWTTGIVLDEATLTIAPPADIQEGDRYTVLIEGLERPDGRPVTLSLAYEFFRLIQIYPESLALYRRSTTPAGEILSPITTDLTMNVGEAFSLICYLLPKNTTEREIIISSNKPGVVQADSGGTITALSPGKAVVTVTAAGGLKVHLPITVAADNSDQSSDPDEGSAGGGITSDVYGIDRKAGFIYNIEPSTSVVQFRKNLQYSGVITVKRPNGQAVTGAVGTGCIVELIREGKVVERLTALVFGDVTGEGNVNTRDVTAIRRHVLQETLLEEPYLRAADTDHDSRVSSLDILILTRYHLGRGVIPKTNIL